MKINRNIVKGVLTIDECTQAVNRLKFNKAPGSDGLASEFYKTFWDDVKHLMIDSINEGFNKGELPYSQRKGIITLLYKKGERNNLDNWRHITLLNYDYKICTMASKLRLHKILDTGINSEQTGYVKGIFSGQNIRLIQDAIEYCTNNGDNGAIIFVDFRKAFDTLEINFIDKCLNKFGFGEQFRKWVSTL